MMNSCDYEYSVTEQCAKGPFYKEHEGRRYCVLHYPGKEKSKDFNSALLRMIENKDYDFRGVWFPEGRWFRGRFFNKRVNFHRATFSAKADFYSAKFSDAVFRHATFEEKADFSSAVFKSEANFKHAKFNSSADFKRTTFEAKAAFEYAVFRADARFSCEKEKGQPPKGRIESLNLRYAVIDRPERISFHNLALSPRWFVDSDPRKFDFTGVTWVRVSSESHEREIRKNIAAEINDLTEVPRPYASLSLAARRLASNAEENNRYDEASLLRYWSMEALRMGRQHDEASPGVLHRLYHFVSGYGERVGRAFLILLIGWALFAALYRMTGHIKARESEGFKGHFNAGVRAANYSLQVITLQKPDPKAEAGYVTPLLVTAETVLGPLQVALLALAIRRKFMR